MIVTMTTWDLVYPATPLMAWLVAGSLKFMVNSIKAKRWAIDLIGYGGMPSTHSTIVSSMASLVALREGIGHPAFGVALTLAFIVMLDAASLRRQVGQHAEAINKLARGHQLKPLRERVGHHKIEIAAGALVGMCVALIIDWISRSMW